MGLTWLIFAANPNVLALVITIAVLQIIIEMLVVRNYLLAAIFITPMTILLAETAGGINIDSETIMKARLLDTVIGSLIGFATGWILHHNSIISNLEKKFRASRLILRRK